MTDWYVAYTRPQAERRAAWRLADLGVNVYLPTETRWCKHARRKTRVQKPLFVRYLFVGFEPDRPAFHTIHAAPEIESFVTGAGGKPIQVSAKLVRRLRDLQDGGTFDYTREAAKPKRLDIKPGTPAKIVSGALAGFDATIIKALGRSNVRILYTLFGRPGEATIDIASLELPPIAPSVAA